MLGVTGFVVGAIATGVLGSVLGLTLVERLVVIGVPPLAFLATIRLARRRAGYERIVFYDCLLACIAASAVAALAIGAPVARVIDVVTIGIGIFLTFGRIGCLKVGCCHGRPARRGVRYRREHVLVGFPRIWQERTVFPIQLIESALSLVLTIVAIGLLETPGAAATCYVAGYGVCRYALEELRGDRDRRYLLGLSEAQRLAVLTTTTAAALHPTMWSILAAAAVVLAGLCGWLSRNQLRRRLLRASHFHEFCELIERTPILQSATTSEAMIATRYLLPDGRNDYVLSHASLDLDCARRLAVLLHSAAEVVPGRTPHVVHVLIPPPSKGTALIESSQ